MYFSATLVLCIDDLPTSSYVDAVTVAADPTMQANGMNIPPMTRDGFYVVGFQVLDAVEADC